MNTAMMSSNKDSWGTPDPIRSVVLSFAHNVLDPCPGATPVGTPLPMDRNQDGLCEQWLTTPTLTYVNPPYGRAIPHWVEKCIRQHAIGSEIILLVPSRTDTAWFHRAIDHATCTLLLKGRLTFIGAEHPAPFPSVLFYFGSQTDRFVAYFGSMGRVVK